MWIISRDIWRLSLHLDYYYISISYIKELRYLVKAHVPILLWLAVTVTSHHKTTLPFKVTIYNRSYLPVIHMKWQEEFAYYLPSDSWHNNNIHILYSHITHPTAELPLWSRPKVTINARVHQWVDDNTNKSCSGG